MTAGVPLSLSLSLSLSFSLSLGKADEANSYRPFSLPFPMASSSSLCLVIDPYPFQNPHTPPPPPPPPSPLHYHHPPHRYCKMPTAASSMACLCLRITGWNPPLFLLCDPRESWLLPLWLLPPVLPEDLLLYPTNGSFSSAEQASVLGSSSPTGWVFILFTIASFLLIKSMYVYICHSLSFFMHMKLTGCGFFLTIMNWINIGVCSRDVDTGQ